MLKFTEAQDSRGGGGGHQAWGGGMRVSPCGLLRWRGGFVFVVSAAHPYSSHRWSCL